MGCISRLLVFIQDNLPFLIQMSGTVYPHPAFAPGFASIMVYKHRRLICLDDVIEIQFFMKMINKGLLDIPLPNVCTSLPCSAL